MSTLMDNVEKADFLSERETCLYPAEKLDSSQINLEQADKVTLDKDKEISSMMIQASADDLDTNLNHKELKDKSQIYEDKVIKHEETSTSAKDYITCKEENLSVTEKKVAPRKRATVRKSKKQNLPADSENSGKMTSAKTLKPKTPTKRAKTLSKLLSVSNLVGQEDKEPMEKYAKVDLCTINSEQCINYTLPPFATLKPEMCDTISCPSTIKQQKLTQYNLENNTNILQHLDYNNLKYTNQQVVPPVNNSWIMASKTNENFALNNNFMQTEVGQSSYMSDKHHMYAANVNYNWKQNENVYFNSVVNPSDPYKLLSENKAYCACSIYGQNCMQDNMYAENFARTNAAYQQVANNTAPNFLLPVNTSSNFLNPATTPFSPFHYHQSMLSDSLKKLYYTNPNNSGYEFVKKENMMPLLNNWHHMNPLMIPNNSLNISPTTPMWYNAPSSSSFNANTSLISNSGKAQFKCEQSTYLNNNSYNADVAKASVYKDQWREKNYFVPYVPENTLPTINTHELDTYKGDNGLTNIYNQQNSTVTSTDNNMMSITDLSVEANAVDASQEELPTSFIYSKDKKLVAKVLESIL